MLQITNTLHYRQRNSPITLESIAVYKDPDDYINNKIDFEENRKSIWKESAP